MDVLATTVREPSVDGCGQPTSYDRFHLVDGRDDTAWMATGDGTGASVRIVFAEPTFVSEVGLVPGYTKVDPCTGVDRFHQMRRVTGVRWQFDDGNVLDQNPDPKPDLQTIALPHPTWTTTVTLTVTSTTEPGRSELDHTPISEIVVS